MKKRFCVVALFCVILVGLLTFESGILDLVNLPNEFYVDYAEVQRINDNNKVGNFVQLSLENKQIATGGSKESENYVVVKLFGFIPIKKVKAKILPEDEVYVGGSAVGLNITSNGAVVVSNCMIENESGMVVKNDSLKPGDVIVKIDETPISSLRDIDKALENKQEQNVNITLLRNNNIIERSSSLIKKDNETYKLGIWVRDDFSGIGTLTFVKKNGVYGALGHAISNGKDENVIPIKNGNIYECSLVGINKGQKNIPGELKCVFVNKDEKGDIKKNSLQGVYGKLDSINSLIDQNVTAKLGGRLSVRPGKAKIVSCVSGLREEYDIEIIKASYQNSVDDKSIVFRVIDEKLIDLTGGIVQGMSGSPILQNDKIVGAVTHVFVSDPTKGYGVYSDWMIENMNF